MNRYLIKPWMVEAVIAIRDHAQGLPDEWAITTEDAAEIIAAHAPKQGLNDTQIKHMVDRFLGWRLPENFSPDAGISFKATFNDWMPVPMKNEPFGTNLFDAGQVEAMVRYLVAGLPEYECEAEKNSLLNSEKQP